MDTRPNYIEMCVKAEEIQAAKTQHYLGDKVWRDNILLTVVYSSATEGGVEYQAAYFLDDTLSKQWFTEGQRQTTWLPRQDQLLGLLDAQACRYQLRLLERYAKWEQDKTFDQIWLEVVMGHKYHKEWKNGELVEKIEDQFTYSKPLMKML